MELAERTEDLTVLLTVRGVVDMPSAPALAERLREILRRRPPTAVIDLTAVTFLATAGISVLAAAQHRCDQIATEFRIVAEGPITARPMELLALDQFFQVYPSVEAAMTDSKIRDTRGS